MLKITNKQKTPIQLIIKSKSAPREYTCLNIPGVGAGKNIYYLTDELKTDYIDRAEKNGFISTKYITNKGE